jgi:hypothetical protein
MQRVGACPPSPQALAEGLARHHLGSSEATKAEIADDGHFIGKPYQAKELLGEIDEMFKEDDAHPLH